MLICLYLPINLQASFDRIRIVITSSSDWTTLKLEGKERIISVKSISLQGLPEHRWDQNSLNMNQPLEDALVDRSMKVQFDIILESENASSLSFESTKGNLGITQIDFFNFNTNTPNLVTSVKNTNISGHPNTTPFLIDSKPLLEGDFGYSRSNVQHLILAFYYPWYSLDSWMSPYLQDKPLIPYNSDDISTIYHHVHLAKQAGIDGFISSWWGPNGETDKNLQKLLSVSEDMDFKVSIYLETLTGPSRSLPESEILSWLRYFLQNYGRDKRFFQLEGKPVIFIWLADETPLDIWERIFNTLKSEDYHAIFIADSLNTSDLQVFDGLHDYGPTSFDEIFLRVSDTVKTYGWLEDNPQLKLWAATAQPGYDDGILPERAGAATDRANGTTYSHTFEAAINTEPDWILISTFNEWWENTHIEPSKNYGNLYLELTAKYADIYKGFQPRPPVDFYVPSVSEPDGSIQLTWNSPFAQKPDSYNIYRDTQPIRNISKPIPLVTGVKGLTYVDIPMSDGKYYYAITAVFGNMESSLSEAFSTISSRNKSKADPSKKIPVDIAIYTESTGWISESDAYNQANLIIKEVGKKVNDIRIVNSNDLPEWVLSHIKNGQPDIILLFGDFPDSIYPSGNQQPDGSLAEIFLDDGNIFLNTADYIFYGNGRNETAGLVNMMDISTSVWGDNTPVKVTNDGKTFTPSLQDFVTNRPFHINELEGTNWELEVSFADNGANLADPVIVRNKKTGGRIGIVFQTGDSLLPRGKVISEIILNWLPTVLPIPVWDVNADGKVDFSDLDFVRSHFGETIKQTLTYNPDVNRDGIVNILDLVLVVLHLGENVKK